MLDTPMLDDTVLRAARTWFGYGRWDAPYWFVGLEQGGSESPEQQSYAA